MNFEDMNPGPIDGSLLHLQRKHMSREIWRLGGGDSMKCRRRNPNQDTFVLDNRMNPLLQSTGFYGVARVSGLQLDWSLLSALVERWRPETHTFHLPMGEATVTLQDVSVLLGLPIDGHALIADVSPRPGMSWTDLVASIFGRAPPPDRFNGSRLQLSFFSSITPQRLPEAASAEDVMLHTRCYLVHIIASVLFTDHSGGSIHPMYLTFLRDLDTCGDYAWGAAVLAFLYRELCKGCKTDKEEVAGCLLLLQLWAWERLPTLAPIRLSVPLHYDRTWDGQLAGPYGIRWLIGHSFQDIAGRTLSVIRTVLDKLSASHFIWEPYSTDIIDGLPAYCLAGRHIWRYRGPIICFFIEEIHVPDRVARQFGMVQSIPADVEHSSEIHKMTLKRNRLISWTQKHQPCIALWDTRMDHIFLADLIVGDSTVAGYHDWYRQRTVRFISRMGAFHHYIGEVFKTIADQTQSVQPDLSRLATDGYNLIKDFSSYDF